MKATIDATGRLLIPKALRATTGLMPGEFVDISVYDGGIRILPQGRTARLERDEHQHLVARSDTVVSDDMVFALLDAGRK